MISVCITLAGFAYLRRRVQQCLYARTRFDSGYVKFQQGFTLIEMVITIAILAIALVTVAQSLQFSAQFGADTLWQTKTVELVQAYSR